MQKLNELLWPEIIKKAVQECERLYEEENKKIVVLEAAVLLKANWQDRVHEVWSTIIPQDEVGYQISIKSTIRIAATKLMFGLFLGNCSSYEKK